MGRTREQGFKGIVSRNGIRETVEAVEKIPVFGNGDIRTIADAAMMFKETGCLGISIGRGALSNPWIFRQLEQWERTGEYDPPGNFEDRLALLRKQYQFLEEQHGEEKGLISFRRTLHWYLKAMRVRRALREKAQKAKTKEQFEIVLEEINQDGPTRGTRTGTLPRNEHSCSKWPERTLVKTANRFWIKRNAVLVVACVAKWLVAEFHLPVVRSCSQLLPLPLALGLQPSFRESYSVLKPTVCCIDPVEDQPAPSLPFESLVRQPMPFVESSGDAL